MPTADGCVPELRDRGLQRPATQSTSGHVDEDPSGMVPGHGDGRGDENPSDTESDDGSLVFDPDAFVSPLTEVDRQRHPVLTEQEEMVQATLASDREAARARQIKEDLGFAKTVESKMIAESLQEAVDRHLCTLSRRWNCCLFLYDDAALRDFVARYDMPFFDEHSSPVAWRDKLNLFKRLLKPGGNVREYIELRSVFEQKMAGSWTQLHGSPSIVASQLLTTHVHLCYCQNRGNPRRVAPVCQYVYGNDVGGNAHVMRNEAKDLLAVLVQLGIKYGVHYVFNGQFVELLLRALHHCEVPTVEQQMGDLREIRLFGV